MYSYQKGPSCDKKDSSWIIAHHPAPPSPFTSVGMRGREQRMHTQRTAVKRIIFIISCLSSTACFLTFSTLLCARTTGAFPACGLLSKGIISRDQNIPAWDHLCKSLDLILGHVVLKSKLEQKQLTLRRTGWESDDSVWLRVWRGEGELKQTGIFCMEQLTRQGLGTITGRRQRSSTCQQTKPASRWYLCEQITRKLGREFFPIRRFRPHLA